MTSPSEPAEESASATVARDRSLRNGVAAAGAFRVITALTPLVMIPTMLGSMGREAFGIWLLAVGVTTFLGFADLGLGNHLMTEVSRLRASGGRTSQIEAVIQTSYGVLIRSAGLLCVIGMLLAATLPWPSWVNSQDPEQSRLILMCVLLTFFATIPASLIVRVMFAHLQSATSYLWQCVGPLLSLAAVMSYATLAESPTPWLLVLLATGGVPLANATVTVVWFRLHRDLTFGFRIHSRAVVSTLLSSGLIFVAISILMASAAALDQVLIPLFESPEIVTDYGVPWRVFSQLGIALSLISIPFWSAASQALARGEKAWVRSRVVRLAFINLGLVLVPGITAVIFGELLLELWVGEQVNVSAVLLIAFLAWWTALAVMYPFFMVQNGAGVLIPQLLGWCGFFLISLPAKLWLLNMGSWELLPWASLFAYLLTVVPAALVGYRRALEISVPKSVSDD